MKKTRLLFLLLLLPLVVFQAAAGGQQEAADPLAAYMEAVDTAYGYELALSMNQFVNSELGGRQAGSDAEHKAADYLVQKMKEIGLSDVQKEEFRCDKWQFNESTLKVLSPAGEDMEIKPYSYASGGTSPEGITAELVYAGMGTLWDYEEMDVRGKIVLIDINMYDNWWITYPSLEAALHGAAAIINSCDGGYAQLAEDSMNCQDFCGPVTIPSVNISRQDAGYLKGLLEAGPVTVNLTVDNVVEPGGKSYNITGKIPGKTEDEIIVVGDHYDVHFWGFQDNNCAIALTLGIAKAMIESGYQPERTLVFVLHGSEEWGTIDSRYDWSTGAWNMINHVHPEWVGKALAYINFELPAYEFGETITIASTPELHSFLADFTKTAPQPKGCFPGGLSDAWVQQTTWADQWSYNSAGVPGLHNGFIEDEEGETYEFYANIYHSQYDTEALYNEAVFDFHHRLYGALVMTLDKNPALALDFSFKAALMKDTVSIDAFDMAGVDAEMFLGVIDDFETLSAEVYGQIAELNSLYTALRAQKTKPALLQEIRVAGAEANNSILAAFKAMQDGLTRLDWWDTEMFGHEMTQDSILVMAEAIDSLEAGDIDYVVDELLWLIEDEWYSYYFSKEVAQMDDESIMAGQDYNLTWGKGRVPCAVDLWEATMSLNMKYGSSGEDVSKEIADLEYWLDDQKNFLAQRVSEEIDALKKIQGILSEIDLTEVITKAKAAVKK
ncbi:MAG: M28 family peptidase [Spirochaetales bacterium]|nr:M28 family peptidase [Spirochaetales bacterium]